MSNDTISRRTLLKGALAGLAAVPAAALVARTADAAPAALAESDPQAKSLGYVLDATKVKAKDNPTFKPGQKCRNCIQFTGKGSADGPCNIFPGKTVKANGWCKVWVLKPGEKLDAVDKPSPVAKP
jgi:High potential iron-sulfur protein